MAYDAGNEIDLGVDISEVTKALTKLQGLTHEELLKEDQLNAIRLDNLNELIVLKKQAIISNSEFEINQEYVAEKEKLKHRLEIQKEAQSDWLKDQQKRIDAEAALQIKQEEKVRKINGQGKLTAAEKRKIEERVKVQVNSQYKYSSKLAEQYEEKAEQKKAKAEKKRKQAEAEEALKTQNNIIWGKGTSFQDRFAALKELTTTTKTDADGNLQSQFDLKKTIGVAVKTLSNLSQQLDAKVEEIALNKTAIDTRLQGSRLNDKLLGSYWDKMSMAITGVAGVSPFVKQEKIVSNLNNLVAKGISYNVTQRAFLSTISEKIATTFDATNGTLLRLVRIQNKDTTAARLGMESALNSFLNTMYDTTEYMSDVMSSVKSSLEESMALMGAEDAIAFEYQIQKWMGSLYSVGMSQQSVQNLTNSLGQLAAGNIESLTGSGAGNLLVMAASNAGLPLSDILAKGLDESSANLLLQSAVNYLAQLYNQSSDNRVVQQQIAKTFGVAASDLKAAVNLASKESTMNSVYGNSSNYTEDMARLFSMAGSMAKRTSMGEMLSNMWGNLQYTMAAGLANDPITYGIYKIAGLLDDVAGGLPLPFVNAMGFGVDLNTSVADLMRAGAMSGSILKGLGSMMIGGGGGFSTKRALSSLGISEHDELKVQTRGEIAANTEFLKRMENLQKSLATSQEVSVDSLQKSSTRIPVDQVSKSGLITASDNYKARQFTRASEEEYDTGAPMQGNANGTDIKNATMADAAKSSDDQLVQAKEEDTNVTNEVIDNHIVDIYNLLSDVIRGNAALTVRPILDTTGVWS